ncbi:MAG: glycosyltransferase family 39 protein [Dehalococcoidia bacterium]|nr:glycosyltransferase family 39 protein [Dehalococcoidia bacterium]
MIANRFGRLLPIVLLFTLAWALRLFLLGSPSIWLDESYTIDVASRGVGDILKNTGDFHPPLYYVFLHFWLTLGRSEFMVRLPSALLGALSVPIAFVLARTWLAERAAFLSALLLAVSPLSVWYSQEARMYSQLAFLGLVSVLALSRLVQGGKPAWWLVYVISTVAGLYTHYDMVALLVIEDVLLVGWCVRLRRRPGWVLPLALAQMASFVLFLPWLPVFVANLRNLGDVHAISQVELLLDGGLNLPVLAGVLFFLLALIVAFFVWLRPAASSVVHVETLSALAVIVFFAALTVFSALPLGTSLKRHVVTFLPYFLLLTVIGVIRIAGRSRSLAVSLVLLACLALGVSYTQRERENWRGAESLVQREGRLGDVILFHASWVRSPFDYYYHGALPQVELSPNDFVAQLSQVAGKYDRAWVILSDDIYVDPKLGVRDWIGREWKLVEKSELAGITVGLYQVPSGTTQRPTSKYRAVPPPSQARHEPSAIGRPALGRATGSSGYYDGTGPGV